LRIDDVLVEGEGTMRLSALRWSVADALDGDNAKRARSSGVFYKPKGDKWLKIENTHTTLAEIADGGKEVELWLIVP
jgi:hypothetical protein